MAMLWLLMILAVSSRIAVMCALLSTKWYVQLCAVRTRLLSLTNHSTVRCQVHDLVIQERKVITTEEYTHLVGGGEEPVVNGMAVGIYLNGMENVPRPYPEWVPFSEAW